VQSLDLTPAQPEALFAIVERQRAFLEKVYARCVELEYPENDLLRQHAARAVRAQRELCLAVNEGRRKGVYRRYLSGRSLGPAGLSCGPRPTAAVTLVPCSPSPPARSKAVSAMVERRRVFLEKVYARCVEMEYPKTDLLRSTPPVRSSPSASSA
jgi:hypothetical protein